MKFLIVAAILWVRPGCPTDAGEQTPAPQAVPAISIKSISGSAGGVSFTVECSVPNPCWCYVRTDQTISGNTLLLKVFAGPLNNEPCIQVVSTVDASGSVALPAKGTYTVRFWKSDEATIDTTIAVQ